MSALPTVLILESDEVTQKLWRKQLTGKVEIISASSVGEAQTLFFLNRKDITAIVITVPPGFISEIQTLVRIIKEDFGDNPIVAVSSMELIRGMLINAGCNYESDKDNLATELLEILGIKVE